MGGRAKRGCPSTKPVSSSRVLRSFVKRIKFVYSAITWCGAALGVPDLCA